MTPSRLALVVVLSTTLVASGQAPALPGITPAMQEMVAAQEITGAVTAVVNRQGVLHLEALGLADVAATRPMTPDTVF